jgi:hypothetical protein
MSSLPYRKWTALVHQHLSGPNLPAELAAIRLPDCAIAGDTSLGSVARFSKYQAPLPSKAWGFFS